MATYKNLSKNSAIAFVEFSPMPEGNLSFFHLSDDTFSQVGHKTTKDDIREFLTSHLGQEIVGDTEINGRPVLITRGAKTQQEIITALEARGDRLKLPPREHQFRPWVWRGNLSMVGQVLQLTSAVINGKMSEKAKDRFNKLAQEQGKKLNLSKKEIDKQAVKLARQTFDKDDFSSKGGLDVATLGFAAGNIGANLTNIFFGAEKVSDPHQLRWLKENFNSKLALYLPEGSLPSPEDERAPLRREPPKPQSYYDRFRGFMQRNSVKVGEIGMRYFGAISLAFPMKGSKWKSVMTKTEIKDGAPVPILKEDGITPRSRFEIASNYEDPFTRRAGYTYLIGKTIGFISKTPDPFDPKPHTWWDTFREKITFRLSSLTEAVAAGLITYDRFRTRRIIIPNKGFPKSWRGTVQRDWFGFAGGALFMVGLVIRFFAPFGSKEMNMEELDAHITDALARVPREKLPQLLAETAASLKEHFKDEVPDMSKIYTRLATDLYRYHGIALPKVPADSPSAGPDNTPQETKAKPFANDGLKKLPNPVTLPRPASHQERAASPAEAPALGA